MKVVYAFLARSAEGGPDGCFSILGGDFDTIVVERFPETINFSVVAKIQFDAAEFGEHEFASAVSLKGETSPELPKERSRVFVGPAPKEVSGKVYAGISVIANIQYSMEREGLYRVVAFIDGKEVLSLPLKVHAGPTQEVPHQVSEGEAKWS